MSRSSVPGGGLWCLMHCGEGFRYLLNDDETLGKDGLDVEGCLRNGV